ncbi:SH2 domain-containing protein 4A [Galendromus occidentalis]|uniref:SH2 domain-containing protein 4A n=1 Tax=Galendromus occidentalis TaxID=34638 RepID=A0AAJ6QQE4_9ACAR|nr:SH2 domain-containing protein 4A [Galendromus occidentalis]
MLANILKNMYVDPALLAELDEEQKSVLFLKMREEQVRRWREREDLLDKENVQTKPRKKICKNVSIMLGKDGKPWTWVMDEPDPNEKAVTPPKPMRTSIASTNGIASTIGISSLNGVASTNGIPSLNGVTSLNGVSAINGSPQRPSSLTLNAPRLSPKIRPVVEVRPMPAKTESPRPRSPDLGKEFPGCSSAEPKPGLDYQLQQIIRNVADLSTSPTQPDKDKWLQEKLDQMKAKEPASAASSPGSPIRHEIFRSTPGVNVISASSEEASVRNYWNQADDEAAWRDQERRAKEADAQRRQTARNAREEIKRSSRLIANGELKVIASQISNDEEKGSDELNSKAKTNDVISNGNTAKPALLPKPTVIKPPVPPKSAKVHTRTGSCAPPLQATSRSKDAKVFGRPEVELWFAESQLKKGTLSENGQTADVAPWFHGFLSRVDAEQILDKEPEGSFLVRVHDRIKGYVVSYRSPEKVKHFLVDASQPSQVQFFGANQLIFATIVDLVRFHTRNPVSITGNELLREGVPLRGEIEDVAIRL